jgi:hypothetical protein
MITVKELETTSSIDQGDREHEGAFNICEHRNDQHARAAFGDGLCSQGS